MIRKGMYLFLICKEFKITKQGAESKISRDMSLRNKVGLPQLLQGEGRRGWWRT